MVELARSLRKESIPFLRTKIVAAIPCFNTQRSIGDIIARTKRYVDEVVVIDDGSTDMTVDVSKNAGAIVLSHGENRGYGEAIQSCFIAADELNADILVIIDGDGQHNPDEIPYLLAPILEGEADLVIGSRFLSQNGRVPLYRKFGIGLITFLWNFGSRVKVTDTQSGFRAYSKKIMKDIHCSESGMSASIEILEQLRKKNPQIKEVPITCSYKDNNTTLSTKAIRHGFGVALSVLKIRLKNNSSRKRRSKAMASLFTAGLCLVIGMSYLMYHFLG